MSSSPEPDDTSSEMHQDTASPRVGPSDLTLQEKKKPFVVCVEGNIGCGKSSMLHYLRETASDRIETVHEPLEEWTNFNGHNALEKLYEDTQRWGFAFNTFAALTRLDMHSKATNRPILVMERSLYSLRYCFVELAARSGDIPPLESSIISKWFDYLHDENLIEIDLFVYVRVDPERCLKRVGRRNRKEEEGIELDFLKDLHDIHESWLKGETSPLPAPVMIIDGNLTGPDMKSKYEECKNYMLEAAGLL